jgi:hypothetical protein
VNTIVYLSAPRPLILGVRVFARINYRFYWIVILLYEIGRYESTRPITQGQLRSPRRRSYDLDWRWTRTLAYPTLLDILSCSGTCALAAECVKLFLGTCCYAVLRIYFLGTRIHYLFWPGSNLVYKYINRNRKSSWYYVDILIADKLKFHYKVSLYIFRM